MEIKATVSVSGPPWPKIITSVTDLEKTITALDSPTAINENTILYLNNNFILEYSLEKDIMNNLAINLPSPADIAIGHTGQPYGLRHTTESVRPAVCHAATIPCVLRRFES